MKWTEILKKAEKIENHYVIIEKVTNRCYGLAVKLTGDPEIKIMQIDTTNNDTSSDFKVGKKHYIIKKYVSLDSELWNRFVSTVDKLLSMDE